MKLAQKSPQSTGNAGKGQGARGRGIGAKRGQKKGGTKGRLVYSIVRNVKAIASKALSYPLAGNGPLLVSDSAYS
jgi:hypothetical protein